MDRNLLQKLKEPDTLGFPNTNVFFQKTDGFSLNVRPTPRFASGATEDSEGRCSGIISRTLLLRTAKAMWTLGGKRLSERGKEAVWKLFGWGFIL